MNEISRQNYSMFIKTNMNRRKTTNMIILHCSATKQGADYKAADIDKWHKQQGWECIGYHYVIDLNGTVEPGRNEAMVGAHCVGKNSNSIGICYIGGVDMNGKAKDTRTYEQKQAMYKLVDKMLQKYNLKITDVYGHRAFAAKECPSFTTEQFRQEFKQWKRENTANYVVCPDCGKIIYLS